MNKLAFFASACGDGFAEMMRDDYNTYLEEGIEPWKHLRDMIDNVDCAIEYRVIWKNLKEEAFNDVSQDAWNEFWDEHEEELKEVIMENIREVMEKEYDELFDNN